MLRVQGSNGVKHKAVFLDRDGTILRPILVLTKPTQVRPYAVAARAIKLLNQLGYLVVVVTNQPIIEKGFIDERGVKKLHAVLQKKLAKGGALVRAFYVCPHRYPSTCRCRKPNIGLVRRAQKEFKIDLKKSFFLSRQWGTLQSLK